VRYFLEQNINYKVDITLDELCLCRYLRARSWNLEKSELLLRESLKWRKEFEPEKITEQDVKGVLSLGTVYHNGFDRQGRPVLYMKPGAYNPYSADERVRFLVYVMEQTINEMDPTGVEKMCWILDFSEYGQRAKSPDSLSVAKNAANILQNHYPERLGAVFFLNAPWYLSVLYSLLSLLLTSETKKKIHWLSGDKVGLFKGLSEFIDEENLEQKYGGKKEPPSIQILEVESKNPILYKKS